MQQPTYPAIEAAIRQWTPAAYTWVRLDRDGQWMAYLSTPVADLEAPGASVAAALSGLEAATQVWLKEQGVSA